MRILLLLFALLPLTAIADTDVVGGSMRLTVKPVLCIIDKKTPSCDMSFLVLWESAQSGYYCLYNDFGEAPVRCWNDERAGRTEDERNVQEDFQYWMANDRNEQQLAAVKVEVLRMDSDDRRRKRRTRHVWDLN
jgi:hypothetical protein